MKLPVADSPQVSMEPESKVHDFCTTSIATDKLNPPLNPDDTDAAHASKNVHQDSTSKFAIKRAEKVMESMNQKRLEILSKIEELKLDKERVIRRLAYLSYRHLKNDAAQQKERLEPLQLALDKLSFRNNAYNDGAIKSLLFEDEINYNNLHFKVLHGNKTFTEERRTLREAKKGQRKVDFGQCATLEELNYSIRRKHYQSNCYQIRRKHYQSNCYCNDETKHRKVVEEIKELKYIREKAIANAAVKGRVWNSLGSKETIQEKINLERDGENLEAVRRVKTAEKKLESIESHIKSLQRRLAEANKRKNRTYEMHSSTK